MTARPVAWAQARWWTEVEAWTAEQLTRLCRTATGPPALFRRRSWSVILRVPTDDGPYWVKQNCPPQAFEASLLEVLSQVSPARVLRPLAVDASSGRMLTADQGPTMRDQGAGDAAGWTQLLVDFAMVQRESAEAVAQAALGLTTLAPADAPGYVDRWVSYWIDQPAPGRMPVDVASALGELGPDLDRWSTEVGELGLPLPVEHSDLHDGNAFAPAPGRPPRVFDFGDATIACPLSSLLVPMRSFAEAGLSQADCDRAVDAYLEVWSDLAPMSRLRAAVPAAINLGVLGRHESWRRTVGWTDPEDPARDDFGDAPVRWLSLLGDPLG